MDELRKLVGHEHELDDVCEALRSFAGRLRAPAVGAQIVGCSDETEREAFDAFQQRFADVLLPNLKLASRSAFRTATLGGRYEWGSVRMAEHHFATPETESSFKLMVVKVTSHVSRASHAGVPTYGRMPRYSAGSDACDALHALLGGHHLPALDDLEEAFAFGGKARIATITDPRHVNPDYRALHAAIVNARIQGRAVAMEIGDFAPATPTYWLITSGVIINVPGLDRELLCGIYNGDFRGDDRRLEYFGLGDDPGTYIIEHQLDRVKVLEDIPFAPREATDHRSRTMADWLEHGIEADSPSDRLLRVKRELGDAEEDDEKALRRAIREVLSVLARERPSETAVRLFACGAAPIHLCYKADKVARCSGGEDAAREVLAAVASDLGTGNDGRLRAALLEML